MKNRILVVIADLGEDEKAKKNAFDTSLDEYSGEIKLFASRPDASVMKIASSEFGDKRALKKKILDLSPSCIFNRFEGWSDNASTEIEFAGLLEEIGIPFTGNSAYTLGLCLNKWGAKELLKNSGVPVPRGIFINDMGKVDTKGLHFPLFLKPCCEDASIGIDKDSFVKDEKALFELASNKLKQFPKGLVAEEFMPGKEYAVGMTGNGPYDVLGVSVLDYSEHDGRWSFLTYDSKWIANAPEYKKLLPSVNSEIPAEIMKKLIDAATKTAKAFKCRGYFRIDTRERDGDIFVIDVNPNPDISEDSGFMRMARKKGYTYEGMLERIISLAGEGK
jgi:D-alanine-D-alanine ligase